MLDYGKRTFGNGTRLVATWVMKHRPTPKGWPARLVAVPLGALAAVAGLEGLAHRWFWYVGYDALTGTFGIAPTLWLVIAGVGMHCRRPDSMGKNQGPPIALEALRRMKLC